MGCQIGAGLINAETDELTSALATSTDQAGQFDFRKWGTVDGGGGMNNSSRSGCSSTRPACLSRPRSSMAARAEQHHHRAEDQLDPLSVGEGMRVIERDAADIRHQRRLREQGESHGLAEVG